MAVVQENALRALGYTVVQTVAVRPATLRHAHGLTAASTITVISGSVCAAGCDPAAQGAGVVSPPLRVRDEARAATDHFTLLCRASVTQSARPAPAVLTADEVMANLQAVSLGAARWRAIVRVPDGWTSTAQGHVRSTRSRERLAVALYIRVSRNDSGQTSLIRAMVAQQHHAILVLEAFMAARGLSVDDVVITGVAYEVRSSYGHSLAARPVAAQLMDQLQRGAVQHVVACSLNRYVNGCGFRT